MDELDNGSEPSLGVEISTPEPALVVVRLSGELDLSNIEALEAEVAPALAGKPTRMIVETSELQFADSSAIALWLRWSAAVERFELHDPSPLLRRVLTAMGLEERLELRP
jgi:anti-anti-sigma factor